MALLSWDQVEARLAQDGIQRGSPQYQQVYNDWLSAQKAPAAAQQQAPGTPGGNVSEQPTPQGGWWEAAKEGMKSSIEGQIAGKVLGFQPIPGYEPKTTGEMFAHSLGHMATSPMAQLMLVAPELGALGLAAGFGGEGAVESAMRGESGENIAKAGAEGVGSGLGMGLLGRLGFLGGGTAAKAFGPKFFEDFVEGSPAARNLYALAVRKMGPNVGTRAMQVGGREAGQVLGMGYGGATGGELATKGVPGQPGGPTVGEEISDIARQGAGPVAQGGGLAAFLALARLASRARLTPEGYGSTRLRQVPDAIEAPTKVEAQPRNEPGSQEMGAGTGAPKPTEGQVSAGGAPGDVVNWVGTVKNEAGVATEVATPMSRQEAEQLVKTTPGSRIEEFGASADTGQEQAEAAPQNEPAATEPGAGTGAPKPGPSNTSRPVPGGGGLPPFLQALPAREAETPAGLPPMQEGWTREARLAAIRQRLADIDANQAAYQASVQREAAVRGPEQGGPGNLGVPTPPSRLAPFDPNAAPGATAAGQTVTGRLGTPYQVPPDLTPGSLPPMPGIQPGFQVPVSEGQLPFPEWMRGFGQWGEAGAAPQGPEVPPGVNPPPGTPPGAMRIGGGEAGTDFLQRLRTALANATRNEGNLSDSGADAVNQASDAVNSMLQRWQSLMDENPQLVTQELASAQGQMLEQQLRLIEILPQLPQNLQDVMTGALPADFFAQANARQLGELYRAFPDMLGIRQTEKGVVLWNKGEVREDMIDQTIRQGQEENIRNIIQGGEPVHKTYLPPPEVAPQTAAKAAATTAPTTEGADVTKVAPGVTLEVTGKAPEGGEGGGKPPTGGGGPTAPPAAVAPTPAGGPAITVTTGKPVKPAKGKVAAAISKEKAGPPDETVVEGARPTTTSPAGAAPPGAAPPTVEVTGAGGQAPTAQTTEQKPVGPASTQPKIPVTVSGAAAPTKTAPAETAAKAEVPTGKARPFETAADAGQRRGEWVEARDREGRLVLGRIWNTTESLVQISRGAGAKPAWVEPGQIERVLERPARKPGGGAGGPSEGGAAPAAAIPEIRVEAPAAGAKAALTAPAPEGGALTPDERAELDALRKQAAGGGTAIPIEGVSPASTTTAEPGTVGKMIAKQRKGAPGELKSMGQQLADILQGKERAPGEGGLAGLNVPIFARIEGKWEKAFATGDQSQGKFRVQLRDGHHEWLSRENLAPAGPGTQKPPDRPK